MHVSGVIPSFTLADRVRKAREVAGLSQQELAERAGMTRGGIARIEQGTGGAPRRSSLIVIAMATGVDLHWLETGNTPTGEPGGGGQCAIRDSNPEPADLRDARRRSAHLLAA